ncbi:MAG: RNA methyltransferase [Lentisphaerae bacterium]|nr:RNA methyltransferase [Lentisphaerota bacterium]
MNVDKDKKSGKWLKNIRVVLVRPIYGGNVGSVCRAMANFGVSELTLVNPQNLNMDEAKAMACWAQTTLKNAKTLSSINEAIADCIMVCGTTARLGLYRQHSYMPRTITPKIQTTATEGKVALIFGPEDSGLSNDDIAPCTHLLQIPSTPEYSSLNLSHAVSVCLYELFVASDVFEPTHEKSPPATSELREKMFEIWEQALLDVGFMKEDKAQHMMLGVRRALSRGVITEDDVRIMMGAARQAQWCALNMNKNRSDTK